MSEQHDRRVQESKCRHQQHRAVELLGGHEVNHETQVSAEHSIRERGTDTNQKNVQEKGAP